jgi:hypothetical protein
MDFEKSILDNLNDGIARVVKEKLGGYDSPLIKMVEQVADGHRQEILSKLNDAFKSCLENPNFEKVLKEEFNRKVAKILLSSLEGSVEKAANVFKSDQTLRAKMIVAIQEILDISK